MLRRGALCCLNAISFRGLPSRKLELNQRVRLTCFYDVILWHCIRALCSRRLGPSYHGVALDVIFHSRIGRRSVARPPPSGIFDGSSATLRFSWPWLSDPAVQGHSKDSGHQTHETEEQNVPGLRLLLTRVREAVGTLQPAPVGSGAGRVAAEGGGKTSSTSAREGPGLESPGLESPGLEAHSLLFYYLYCVSDRVRNEYSVMSTQLR